MAADESIGRPSNSIRAIEKGRAAEAMTIAADAPRRESGIGRSWPMESTMRQSRTGVLRAVLVTTFAVSAVAVSAQPSFAQSGAVVHGSPADMMYAQAGQRVDVGGFRLNLYCMGSGSPAVVFDSGWEDWAPAWSTVQPQVAKWTRACSYDRAGAGFSDPGPMPRTSVRIARELHTALHRAHIAGPTFWWETRLAVTTCEPLRTCTWTRSRGW
jgi:hypothetical protein